MGLITLTVAENDMKDTLAALSAVIGEPATLEHAEQGLATTVTGMVIEYRRATQVIPTPSIS